MLDRESQRLDLQEISFAEETIEINTQSMGGKFSQQTGTQAPKGMSVVDLNVELLGQLTVDGLDNLANGVERASDGLRRLVGLVAARQGHQVEAILAEQLTSQFSADVALVAKDGQIGMFGQQFSAHIKISRTGGSQLKIQDHPAQADQQMQLEAEDGDFLAGNLAKIRAMRCPVACR